MYEEQFDRIEKIKIIGSTFMAACGLISGRESSIDYENEEEAFTKGENARTMAKFAAAMMRSLQEMDYDKFELQSVPDFKLRIGLCAGKVIAGVVGAQKPLYDIWGDTVNIAARMDYTAERGKIHIPKATAYDLMNLDSEGNDIEESVDVQLLDPWIQCNYRDNIKVKGKGIMTTYYIELTEDSYLVENNVTRMYSDTEDLRFDRVAKSISILLSFTGPCLEITVTGLSQKRTKSQTTSVMGTVPALQMSMKLKIIIHLNNRLPLRRS